MHNLLEKIPGIYYTINMCESKVGSVVFLKKISIIIQQQPYNMHNIHYKCKNMQY